jgi:hypothetical protein
VMSFEPRSMDRVRSSERSSEGISRSEGEGVRWTILRSEEVVKRRCVGVSWKDVHEDARSLGSEVGKKLLAYNLPFDVKPKRGV